MTSPDPNFDGIFNFADLSGAIQAVPELRSQPSLAAAVAQSGATGSQAVGVAQGLVGAAQSANTDEVVKRAHRDGLFGHLASAISGVRTGVWDRVPGHDLIDHGTQIAFTPVTKVLNYANRPLGGVQHQYRFVRDVFDKHGVVAGVGELLAGATAGAVGAGIAAAAGLATAGPGGAIAGGKLGAEGGLELAGKFGPYHDSWNRTRNGDTYRLHGRAVSIGRDVAGAIGLNPHGNENLQGMVDSVPILGWVFGDSLTGKNLYDTVSGGIDGTADVFADPLMGGSKLAALNRARTVITSTKDFERIAANPPARLSRMLTDVAHSDTGQIIEHYPTLRPLAPQLGKATTPDEVVDVFRQNLATADLLGTKGLPSYSVTRVPFRKVADSLRNISPQDTTGMSPAELAAILPGHGIKSMGETIVRAVSNRTPFAMDPTTNELLTTGWAPSNPRAAGILYKMVQTHQSKQAARAAAVAFAAETDPALQYKIWNDAHAQTVALALAKHGVTDPKVLERVTAELTDHTGMGGGGRESHYGYDAQGNPVDRIPAGDDGATVGSALWETQAGKLYTINWSQLNSVARALGTYSKYYGKVEDGAYNHIIAPLFKPQALLTGGFAFRNSGNEMFTRIIGGDGLAVVRSLAEKTAAKLNYRLTKTSPALPDEVDHLTAALNESTDTARLMSDPLYGEVATRLLLESNGHILPPALDAGHHATAYGGDDLSTLKDQVAKVIAQATGRGRSGERLDPSSFVDYTSADGDKFARAMSGAAAMIARDPAGPVMAKAYRAALPGGRVAAQTAATRAGVTFLRDTERGKYQTGLLQSGKVSATPETDPLVSLATRRAHALEGLIVGQDGTVNRALLDGIADHDAQVLGRTAGGLHPNLHPDTINSMDLTSLPVKVAGMETKPLADIGAVQNIQNKGFSILGSMINRMSREPIYVHHVTEEYKLARTVPGLTDDEAWQLAQTRAAERMIPEIHNPQDRSQFALAARSYLPFFFAREQAYRRLATAIMENPLGFRKVQLLGHAMKNVGWVQTDPQTGQDYFTYPFSGAIADKVPAVLSRLGIPTATGIPGGFRGSIQGLAAGGEAPGSLSGIGWSPLLSIPVRSLASLDPQAAALVEKIEGPAAAGQSNWAELIPNSPMRKLLSAMAPGLAKRSFVNAQIDALQYAIARGDTPPNPTLPSGQPDPAYSAWMDRFVTHTRIMMGLSALYGIGAPSSPQLRQGSKALTDLAAGYISKYGLQDGTRRLFADHPNMTSYEVFRTKATAALPDTEKAVEWAQKNSAFIRTYGKTATFFAPQTAEKDPGAAAARNAEIGLGLRARVTPDQYVSEVVAQTGWNEYQQSKTARDAAIAAHPGDDAFATQQYSNFRNYVQTDLARRNPLWFSQYNNLDGTVEEQRNLIEQARQIIATKAYPAESAASAALIGGLLGDYDQHMSALAATGGNSSLYATAKARAERDNWKNYLTTFVTQHPEAAIIANRLFKGA